MLPVFLLITSIFTCIAFISNVNTGIANPLFAYFYHEIFFILRHLPFFLTGFLILSVFLYRSVHKKHKISFISKYFRVVSHILKAAFICLFAAFFLLLLIGYIEINLLSLVIRINPGILGIIHNTEAIVSTLKKNDIYPEVVISKNKQSKEFSVIASALIPQNSFYISYIIPLLADFSVIPIKISGSNMYLSGNTLVIKGVNVREIQSVSPIISYQMVKHYFPDRRIKSYPNVKLLNRDEYITYRQGDADKRLAKVDNIIENVQTDIRNLEISIQNDNKELINIKNDLENELQQGKVQYIDCINAGSFRSGVFYHTNTEAECRKQLESVNNLIIKGNKDLTKRNIKVQENLKLLNDYIYYMGFYKLQKDAVRISKYNLPYEIGVFEPADSIKVTFISDKTVNFADYFTTLTHEYLHYTSYKPGKKFTEQFFEEGLTEYFARQIIKDSLNIDTKLGYPVYVRIISEMTKLIPESELADIYFNQDEQGLKEALNRVYGDNFYDKHKVVFETFQYTSDPKQILKLANIIMAYIGGEKLKEDDLMTAYNK